MHDRSLKLKYKIKEPQGKIRFGFLLLEFSPDGKKLTGLFVSYAAEANARMWGNIELKKDS